MGREVFLSLQQIRKNKMKHVYFFVILISLLNTIGCDYMSTGTKEISLDKISCSLRIAEPDEKGFYEEVHLTFENMSQNDGILFPVLPLDEDKDITNPFVCLLLTNKKTGETEAFIYTTTDSERKKHEMQIYLREKEKFTKTISTMNFCQWGSCGPGGRSFRDNFKAGNLEVEVKAGIIFGKNKRIESNPVNLSCSFSESFFRGNRGHSEEHIE